MNDHQVNTELSRDAVYFCLCLEFSFLQRADIMRRYVTLPNRKTLKGGVVLACLEHELNPLYSCYDATSLTFIVFMFSL